VDEVIIVVLNGVLFASYLFLVSAGLTFIYGVMRILNVAHGSLYGLGAYTGAWLILRLWPGGHHSRSAARASVHSPCRRSRRSHLVDPDLCSISHPRRRHEAGLGR